jgi:heme O synthase-like polyprenyltransferase
MLGWTAATGSLAAGAWILGALLFVWQIPHFLALAWMYRDDYARGGFRMLPASDPTGRLTSLQATLYSFVLIPLCLLLVRLGYAGWPFAILSVLLGLWLTAMAIRFARTCANADARRLFLTSIVYLPVLTVALMVDSRGPYDGFVNTTGGYVLPSAHDGFTDSSDLPPAATPSINIPTKP